MLIHTCYNVHIVFLSILLSVMNTYTISNTYIAVE